MEQEYEIIFYMNTAAFGIDDEASPGEIFYDILENLHRFPDRAETSAKIWSDGFMILCNSEDAADKIADWFEELIEENGKHCCATTGYFDPEEDARNNEVDELTGWYYVNIV